MDNPYIFSEYSSVGIPLLSKNRRVEKTLKLKKNPSRFS
jgi:hypothetical protein